MRRRLRGYEDADDVDEVLNRLIETGEKVISDSYYEYFNASQNIDDLLVLYDYDMMLNMLNDALSGFEDVVQDEFIAGYAANTPAVLG